MKIYKLTLKAAKPVSTSLSLTMSSSSFAAPSAEKVEYFSDQTSALRRKKEIEDAVTRIALVPWLVSVDIEELEVRP